MKDIRDSVREDRVQVVQTFGFTERQARFLVTVMVYAGVFLERQYCAFAGIKHGQNTHDFLATLADRRQVTLITPGRLHRGRLFHVQYKPFYEAIGEPNNRHRKPASLGRLIERLMILDAVLADNRYSWLGTEQDKLAYFRSCLLLDGQFEDRDYPHLVFGEGPRRTVRYFPDKLPIGLERDYGHRHVFLYLVTREVPTNFRMFLFRHTELLKALPAWTIRLVVPRRFRRALSLYRYAVRDECATPLEPSLVDTVEWLFHRRQGAADPAQKPCDYDLEKALPKMHTARMRARYRMWQLDPHGALWNLKSHILRDQLTRREGRLEAMVLPYQYLQLASLVGIA